MRLWAGWPRRWRSEMLGEARGRADADRDALAPCAAAALARRVSTSVAARETATVPGVVDPFADVVPGALAPAERAADELSAIRMDVALDPASGTIGGEMSVTWRNPASQPLRTSGSASSPTPSITARAA